MYYDIHGRVGIKVAADAPGGSQLADMFASVATDKEVPANLLVTKEHRTLEHPSTLEDELLYTQAAVIERHQDVGVSKTDLGYEITGRGELLTAVVPLVDNLMTRSGAAMIHAATVTLNGVGIALPAGGGTGKTSTMAKLLRQPGFAFMGDDWAFLDKSGDLLGFQKPMFIKAHHRTIYPHLFDGRRKPLVPKAVARPVGKMTTVVHPHIVKYPRLAKAARRWSPEHRMVPFRTAFPDAPMATSAPLALAVYVERYDGAVSRMEERSTKWMVDRMLGNFHYEMAAPSQELLAALSATNLLPLERFLSQKREVLTAGLGTVPTFLLRVPVGFSADQASDDVVRRLATLTDGLEAPMSGAQDTGTDGAQ